MVNIYKRVLTPEQALDTKSPLPHSKLWGITINKLKLTNLQREILRLLFVRAGILLNQRQIAMSLNVSQPSVMKALPILEKENFILIRKDKETKRWAIE